jgi:transcriptional regulator with XRE-family HTH domain
MRDRDRAFYAAFGRRVREAREKARITQSVLAGRVELRRTSVTNIEAGSQGVPLHLLPRLAEALGVAEASLIPERTVVDRGAPVPKEMLVGLDRPLQGWVEEVVGGAPRAAAKEAKRR